MPSKEMPYLEKQNYKTEKQIFSLIRFLYIPPVTMIFLIGF